MNKLLCLTTAFLLITVASLAQSFRFQATVDSVQQSGFHRILLPPDVVGHLNETLTDLRLYDSQQHEVPYRLLRQQPAQTTSFIDYEVISKKSIPNVSTRLIVRNRSKSRITSLGLVVKNTNVDKKAQLSGSSDAQNWYALDDYIWLSPTQNHVTTKEIKQIDFPLSDYEYYRLVINDSLSTPLNILQVGHYTQLASAGTYSTISNLKFSQRDSSDKKTYVHLTSFDEVRFDKLILSVRATTPFRRQAEIGQFRTRKRKRGRIDRWFEVVRSIDLSSSLDSNVVYLPSLKTKDLYVVIANNDNPPLVINNVRAYQLTTYLLANLTANQPYQLHFSANDVAAPDYDPTPFQAVLSLNSPIINVGVIHPVSPDSEQHIPSFFTDSRIIWPALGVVLFVLGLLSYRMLREMGKANG